MRAPHAASRAAAIDDRRPAAAAQRALRQTIHDGPRMSAQRQIMGPGVVQRRVGFEFEMGDINTQTKKSGAWVAHAKGATMQTFAGYRLTADVDTAGDSQLEVIIDPIDETANGAEAQAQALGDAARDTIDIIASGASAHKPHYRRADLIQNLNGSKRDRYRSNPSGAGQIRGQLQMTAGVPMAKLHAHATGQQADDYIQGLDPHDTDDQDARATLDNYTSANIGSIATTATTKANARMAGQGVAAASLEQLGAVAGMMANVPISARRGGNIDYAKMTAGAMLARTDFSKILMQLPGDVRSVLTPADLEHIVVETVIHYKPAVTAADPIFPAGAVQGPDLSGLTIGEWTRKATPTPGVLWGTRKGKDKLTKKRFPGSKTKRRAVESMGSYGDRLDPGARPIFEFRTLNGVTATDLGPQLARLVAYLNR